MHCRVHFIWLYFCWFLHYPIIDLIRIDYSLILASLKRFTWNLPYVYCYPSFCLKYLLQMCKFTLWTPFTHPFINTVHLIYVIRCINNKYYYFKIKLLCKQCSIDYWTILRVLTRLITKRLFKCCILWKWNA